jgi:hypothetical protein
MCFEKAMVKSFKKTKLLTVFLKWRWEKFSHAEVGIFLSPTIRIKEFLIVIPENYIDQLPVKENTSNGVGIYQTLRKC